MRSNVCDAVSALLPRPVREGITEILLQNIFERLARAVRSGTIDQRSDRHISWMQLRLDEQGWDELIALKAEQLEKEMALQAVAAQRLAKDSTREVTVLTSNIGVELPSVDPGPSTA
jgi:hypothetical protein